MKLRKLSETSAYTFYYEIFQKGEKVKVSSAGRSFDKDQGISLTARK